jgi:NAD(P)-dependent dehydrogenase (short-subunit alcohol dehydrogenase family)
MSSALLIYGATGYVGQHVARGASALGVKAIVAGRDAAKLDRIARETGLEHRAFGLDDPAAIDSALNRVAVVLNCAGPFKYTAEPLVEGCLRCPPTISTSPARSQFTRPFRRGTDKRRPAASCCSRALASMSSRPIASRCT